ncbi:MAG TPA: citrate synthase [bacterium]
MEAILDKIEQLEREHDQPDPALLRRFNIKLGLRNADGSGVVVGLTAKGTVIGYVKVPKGGGTPAPEVLNNLHIPGLPSGTHVSPALAIYYLLHGIVPSPETLKSFESRLADQREYEIRPVEGELYYCGYNVAELVRHIESEQRFGFEEAAYLLLTGALPSRRDLGAFTEELSSRRSLPKAAQRLIMSDSANEDQMNALHRSVSAMSLFDEDPNSRSLRVITRQGIDLLAKIPTIVAYNYQATAFARGHGTGLITPRPELSTAENFLYMLNGREPDPQQARLLDMALILHAEHGGGNNSTFTVRVVSSSQANTYMALTSGIASLSGHLHGGANEAVMRMMRGVKDAVGDWTDEAELEAHLQRLLDREAGDKSGKLYGIGHAVYTRSDPRAGILERHAGALADALGRTDEFRLYQRTAAIGSALVVRQKGKPVAPNVDFYSGLVYDMLGIPVEVFTPLFAMARVAGWTAHRLEQLLQQRIIRPAYVSSFTMPHQYVPLSART